MRILDGDQIAQLLPCSKCIDVVRKAMITTSARQVKLPLRHAGTGAWHVGGISRRSEMFRHQTR